MDEKRIIAHKVQNISIDSASLLEKRVNQLKIDVQKEKNEKYQLQDEMTEFQINSKVTEDRLANELKETKKKLETKTSLIADLESKLLEEAKKSEESLAANSEKDRERFNLKTENKVLKEEITELLANLQRLQDELDKISQEKLTFKTDCKQLRANFDECKNSLSILIREKKNVDLKLSDLQIVCEQQRFQIADLRPPLDVSVESDISMTYRSPYILMADTPGHSESIYDEQIRDIKDMLNQTTNEKNDALEKLEKTKQAYCTLSNFFDQFKKEIDTALPPSPRASSCSSTVIDDSQNTSTNDTDTSETDLKIYQAWLESVRNNVVKHNLAFTAATRDKATLIEQLREKDRAIQLLSKQLTDIQNDKEQGESSTAMIKDKLARPDDHELKMEANNGDLRQELGSMFTSAQVMKLEQTYKDEHERKLQNIIEEHNKNAKDVKQQISHLEEINRDLKEKLKTKNRDELNKSTSQNKVGFSPRASANTTTLSPDSFTALGAGFSPRTSANTTTLSPDSFTTLGARPKNFSPFKVDPSHKEKLRERNEKQPPHLKSTNENTPRDHAEEDSERDPKTNHL